MFALVTKSCLEKTVNFVVKIITDNIFNERFTIQLLILPLSPYSIIYRLKINADRGHSERSLHFNTYKYSEIWSIYIYALFSFNITIYALRS